MPSPNLPLPLLLLAAAAALSPALAAPPAAYVNSAIARTVELGGATTAVTTQLNVKALRDAPGDYYLALGAGAGGGDRGAWYWEVQAGGAAVQGEWAEEDGIPTLRIPLPQASKDSVTSLTLTATLANTSAPLPAEIAQRDDQFLLWTSDTTYVPSWYPTDVERIKIRAPHPNILSYTSIPSTYTRDNVATKAGATLTLGPFYSLPATLGGGKGAALEDPAFSVHYEHREAVVGVEKLRRSVEVSHWGANVNVQDEIELVNMGPRLKGQFSRLAHQQSKFHATKPAQILTDLVLKLPASAHSVYYYDTIGNVSTSRFRPGSSSSASINVGNVKTVRARASEGSLELRPRYPLLGGWRYAFVTGYDQPLGDVARVDKATGRYSVKVPMINAWKDLVVREVETVFVLPEGAKDIEVHTPFAVDSIEHSTTKTYLDSTGRHTVTIRKRGCTVDHAQDVVISYAYSTSALLQKPLTVATVVAGLFVLAMGLRRVDVSIEKK